MKTITLEEAYSRATKGKLNGCKRVHPHVDVGNSDGPQPMPEISQELEGGDWYDIGYCHKQSDAELMAHCFNHFQEVVAALQDAFMQFEHNGDESDEDRAILDKMQSVIAKSNQVTIA